MINTKNPNTTIIIGDSRRMEELKDENVHLNVSQQGVFE
jgi:hypothetical protein